MNRDNIYAEARAARTFQFDREVVGVFPDMIARSVPGYSAMLLTIEQIAARFCQPATNAYDLGCSLGAATFRIQAGMPSGTQIIAVDNSAAMVEQFRSELTHRVPPHDRQIELVEADINEISITNASLAVLNLTLQFVPLEARSRLLGRIFEGLVPNGAVLLSEKISFEKPEHQRLITEMHHDFKRANGYSDLEIAQKRNALERTLIPETMAAHVERLEKAGFGLVVPWFQCFNFVSLLAVKTPNE